jgi:tRNA(fMet)-specific endonuclease VapC
VVISAITAAELEFGVVASGLEEVPVAPFDAASARAHAPVRWATRHRRRDALDKLIASHALALGVTLVTNNPADFSGTPDLSIENWVAYPPRFHGRHLLHLVAHHGAPGRFRLDTLPDQVDVPVPRGPNRKKLPPGASKNRPRTAKNTADPAIASPFLHVPRMTPLTSSRATGRLQAVAEPIGLAHHDSTITVAP